MAITPVNRGTVPNDGTGDTPFDAFGKVNANEAALESIADSAVTLANSAVATANAIAATANAAKVTANAAIPKAQRAAANGVATLDGTSRIPVAQLPASLASGLDYAGTWNADTNTPALASGAGVAASYYVVTTAGTTNLDGETGWQVGDWAVFDGTAWARVPGVSIPAAVRGQPGGVADLNEGGRVPVAQAASPGFLPLTSPQWAEVASGAVHPIASRLNDGFLYGTISGQLHRSTNGGATWTAIGTAFPATPSLLLDAGDGEVLAVTAAVIYKTTSWGGAFTSSAVLTSTTTATFLSWGVDTVPSAGLAVATHYQAGNLAGFEQSRYVWLSQDHGATWAVVRDLDATSENDRHLHFAAFDPWNGNRIWISHHQFTTGGSGKAIEYSDDLGVTWSPTPLELEWNSGTRLFQPTTATATPYGVVMGTDDSFSGLIIVRDPVVGVELLAEGPPEPGLTTVRSFATYSQLNPDTGTVVVTFNQQIATGLSYVMATDGRAGSVLYAEPEPLPILAGGLPGFSGYSEQAGMLYARARRPSIADPAVQGTWVLTAPAPVPGRAISLDTGKLAGGKVGPGNTANVAVGLGSEAIGVKSVAVGSGARALSPNRSLAVGPDAVAGSGDEAVAVGPDAVASTQAVALGTNANATVEGVAVGRNAVTVASAAVAVGRNASANATSVAVGADAIISAGSLAVAVGRSASAANAAVAVGASAATGNDGTAVGYLTSARDGTAVGRQATAAAGSARATAIGHSASAGTDAVALGRNASSGQGGTALGAYATAGFSGAVALGFQTTATTTKQVAIGDRHIEMTDLAADPAAPAAGAARLYALGGKLYYRTSAGIREIAVVP